jgi:iron(III) transport system substrate-binding protein
MKGRGSRYVILALVLLVLTLPFFIRGVKAPGHDESVVSGPADQLVIMTPHLEAVRRKFGQAFSAWYVHEYHRAVSIEYLSYGGGDIIKFLQASEAAYGRSGTYNVDLIWGGSDSMFTDVLQSRYLDKVSLDPRVMAAAFPSADIGGVPLYDTDPVAGPRWFGAALSSFGIMYNRDVLNYLHLPEPRTWADLADPRYSGWIELADPTRSASAKAALMVIVEREMESATEEHRSREYAWARGMGLIRQIAANAKGFAAAANELPSMVSAGDAAAAMSIDFYARSQIAAVGGGRVGYVEPQGATIVTPEPIGLVRGAPNAQTARRFIEFVLSDAGQRLWITKAAPGEGPEMALQRLPVVRSVYQNPVNFTEFTDPFTTAGGFNTKPSRRAAFGLMDELVSLCCIDLLTDLRQTRRQIVGSRRAAELDARLGMFPIDESASQAAADIHRLMLKGKPEDWLTLQLRWREEFRAEYRELRNAAGQAPAVAARVVP